MANKRLKDFPSLPTPNVLSYVYLGDSDNAYRESKTTVTELLTAYSAALVSIAGLTTAADKMIYTTAPNVYATTDLTAIARILLASTTAVDMATAIGALPITGGTMTGSLILNADPVLALEAATKQYVDQTALSGTSVYAATTATLNATQSGAGAGAKLTDASGTFAVFSVDGVSPPLNSIILNKDQTNTENQGIYELTTNGDGASIPWVLTRSTTYDTPAEINNTGLIVIQNGSTLKGSVWYNATTIVTVDTTAFSYDQYGALFATAGANSNITSLSGLTTPLSVSQGGSGRASATAYGVICGGTTSTGANQSIASVGTAGQVLTSNGAGALPTMEDATGSGIAVQTGNTQTGAVATGATTIPIDDTIPQSGEGTQFMTLTYTPLDAANILEITVNTNVATASGVGNTLVSALFQDSTADSLACCASSTPAANFLVKQSFKYRMVAGTASATTFKVRIGCQTATGNTFNGTGGARRYGGVLMSSINITEYLP